MTRERGRSARARIGLALAGGGPGGAVYEIGALCALEEAIEGLDVTRLDVYVGVSAGAVLAAGLANGMGSRALCRLIIGRESGEDPFVPEIFFTPGYRELARRALSVPRLLAGGLASYLRRPGARTLLESLAGLAQALPVGVFDNEPIRRYLARVLRRRGRTDDFRRLRRRLVVVAADLESGRPIRFGEPGWDHVPISRAVQASTALPGLYPPVEIEGRYCVDGVLLKTVHASVALEQGMDLLFCVNPIVPVDTRAGIRDGALRRGAVVEAGLASVLSQTFRTLIHSRLQLGFARYAHRFPGTDVLLFEPGRDEYRMFFSNIFSFSSRRDVCELAYRETRLDLQRRFDELAPALARHGLHLRADVLADESRTLWEFAGLSAVDSAHPVSAALERTLSRVVQRAAETSEPGASAAAPSTPPRPRRPPRPPRSAQPRAARAPAAAARRAATRSSPRGRAAPRPRGRGGRTEGA